MSKEISQSQNFGYLALCYHYIRLPLSEDPFPRILGTWVHDFHAHIAALRKRFIFLTPEDAHCFSYGQYKPAEDRLAVLLTFDDGLSDHHLAARILHEYGISAFFFIPTCTLQDSEPANPTILHYALAIHRLSGVLSVYHEALENERLSREEYGIEFKPGADDPWETIKRLKRQLKYRIPHSQARRILLFIYEKLLKTYQPDMLSTMHLTSAQVRDIIDMGHHIGTHSHTHLSVGAADLTPDVFRREVITPQRYLERTFGADVRAFSYPFGGAQDILKTEQLVRQTDVYRLAYTVEPIVNKQSQSPFELGRYTPYSSEDAPRLMQGLERIIDASRQQ